VSGSSLHHVTLKLSLFLTGMTNISLGQDEVNEVTGVEANDSSAEAIFPPSVGSNL
jgi:hypothetical protein